MNAGHYLWENPEALEETLVVQSKISYYTGLQIGMRRL
jgi:hypothetical protein